MGIEQQELEKLSVLLPHWIEHNMAHAQEFREWASRAGEPGSHIMEAARLMEDATQALEAALEALGGHSNSAP